MSHFQHLICHLYCILNIILKFETSTSLHSVFIHNLYSVPTYGIGFVDRRALDDVWDFASAVFFLSCIFGVSFIATWDWSSFSETIFSSEDVILLYCSHLTWNSKLNSFLQKVFLQWTGNVLYLAGSFNLTKNILIQL